MTRFSGLWRLDAFFDAQPPVDYNTRVAVVVWVMALLDDPSPTESVEVDDPILGSVRRGIVGGTDVEVTYRIMVTGSPRFVAIRRVR